ncbi:hypothetical protein D3C71_1802770 [compost metagenome]
MVRSDGISQGRGKLVVPGHIFHQPVRIGNDVGSCAHAKRDNCCGDIAGARGVEKLTFCGCFFDNRRGRLVGLDVVLCKPGKPFSAASAISLDVIGLVRLVP